MALLDISGDHAAFSSKSQGFWEPRVGICWFSLGRRKGPSTQIVGFQSKDHLEYAFWDLKPYYLGTWTLWVSLAVFRLGSKGRAGWLHLIPRGSIYTTIMELGPKRPFLLWFWGPNSIMVVYVDPLGSFTSFQYANVKMSEI